MNKDKLLLPWKKMSENCFARFSLTGSFEVPLYTITYNEEKQAWLPGITDGKFFADIEEAKKFYDEIITSFGYKLLTEKQAEKLRVLL